MNSPVSENNEISTEEAMILKAKILYGLWRSSMALSVHPKQPVWDELDEQDRGVWYRLAQREAFTSPLVERLYVVHVEHMKREAEAEAFDAAQDARLAEEEKQRND